MRKNKKISLVSKFILFINILVIIGLFLSYLAKYTNPADYWFIAFFGLSYPIILFLNFLIILYWLIRKKWYALISIISILLGYNSLTSTIGFRGKTESSFVTDSNTLKLMTYNVHYFKKFGLELDTHTRSGIFNLLRNEQPDIIGFQEFFTRNKGKYNIKDSVFNILDTKYYYYNPSVDNNYESSGIAVFSKLPIKAKGNIDLKDDTKGNQGIWVDIEKNNKIFRVFIVHLASISFQPEDYSYLNKLKQDLNTEEDLNSGKRIIKRLKNAFIKRSMQVKYLQAYIDSCKTPYIIMGDFNDTPVSYTLHTLKKDIKNGFEEKGSGLGITYNGDFPNFQIDYILASKEFDFKTYKIIKKTFSDHYPVRCNVTLAD
ncbi:endonuclease/exonuclease/phosphatase family protein [Pedobacter aquae]|uniref:Endonuclease/exonuclease/phosphatase family protein n=1 Tax=Pedobacter aquae TaxID=2605747 RepID=A0A5C0VLZ5_9SPHI|nr:endonuclease/exonuclease/phosphatase family protein [Pedobacter aquae]QEK52004.1 endonuclease/exonuclease/phosphatase family protein [Pedobacter aquae]